MGIVCTASKFASAVGVAVLLSCATASATVINFDNLGNGVLVTNQYAGVTFSAGGGSGIYTSAQLGFATSSPNFICTGTASALNCDQDIFVDFSTAVSGLSFNMTGDNNLGVIARANVYDGAILLGGLDILGDGSFFNAQLIDLSAFSGITRLEIVNDIDGGGLAYDDFSFTTGAVASVPEPVTFSLFGAGLLGAAALRRRKLNKA